MLKSTNWMPWTTDALLAPCCDTLDRSNYYIANENVLPGRPRCARIELAMNDAEMFPLIGGWNCSPSMIMIVLKESEGCLGTLATRRKFYGDKNGPTMLLLRKSPGINQNRTWITCWHNLWKIGSDLSNSRSDEHSSGFVKSLCSWAISGLLLTCESRR